MVEECWAMVHPLRPKFLSVESLRGGDGGTRTRTEVDVATKCLEVFIARKL